MNELQRLADTVVDTVVYTQACFIQSCPFGPMQFKQSKRASAEWRWSHSAVELSKVGSDKRRVNYASAQCASCGPADAGTCFGPSICCLPGQGCLVGDGSVTSQWNAACKTVTFVLVD